MLAWKVWYFVAVCGTSASCTTEETHEPNTSLEEIVLCASLEGMLLCGSLWYLCQLYKQKKPMHPMLAWKVCYFVAVCGTCVSCTNRRNPCTQR